MLISVIYEVQLIGQNISSDQLSHTVFAGAIKEVANRAIEF
jgi:hypothetical protein